MSTTSVRTRGLPPTGIPTLRRFARTTPGLVIAVTLLLVASCAVAAAVCAAGIHHRIALQDKILGHSEPFAFAAQNLYAALSEADATAASAFLSGGIQTPAMRERYNQSLAAAASAMGDVTAGATDIGVRTEVAEIAVQLTTYTGLIEAARVNNMSTYPVGSAYLREASSLMQTELLPGAKQILDRGLAALNVEQASVGALPVIGLLLLVLVLAEIAVASWFLLRRTNRQFNIGLVVAAGFVVLAIIALVAGTRVAADEIDRGRAVGTERFEHLATGRILAQQARTDEILELIARSDITALEKSYAGHMSGLLTELETGPQSAVDAVHKWTASHDKQVRAYRGGDFATAMAQAIGTDPDASPAQFTVVETALRAEIEETRTAMRATVSSAGAALAWTPAAIVVTAALAAAAVIGGMWPRLKEFL
ncbi:hypothetical protein [Mycolicibacterium psychrotolerans]|uniref:Uncharacterized protein n=1 Tax=Mycolicibacterium psychrotolerans TaxID=216929 RepID=A0A7I7M894_9MYCO|nr:hypothetical protein [Mycolicibacterium psychrotolerans]BBX67589.1 hypothetical protein MPSYJ_10500 [Mycolicibacterium psychrotolerans]